MILKGGVAYEVWSPGSTAPSWTFYPERYYFLDNAITHWPDAPTSKGWEVRVGPHVVARVLGRNVEPVSPEGYQVERR